MFKAYVQFRVLGYCGPSYMRAKVLRNDGAPGAAMHARRRNS